MSELSFPILEEYSHNVNYINSCWFNDVVRLLKKRCVEIKFRNKCIPPIQRENNALIMETILANSSSITTNKKLNACSLYLQFTFLSNITNLIGDTLLPTSLQGIRA